MGEGLYAACVNNGGATYLCSGDSTVNTTTQTINANEAAVSTAPGFGINTGAGNAITVTGNLTFNTGSTFLVQVNGTSSDVVDVTGNVTIQSGATLDVVPLGSFSSSSTPFLSAGGSLTGRFATVDLNGVDTTIIYSGNSASFALIAVSPSVFNAQTLSLQGSNLLFSDMVAGEATEGALSNENMSG